MTETLSLLGMYSFDPAIKARFVLPVPVDEETVWDWMCLQTAELSLLYTEPETLKWAIGVWCTKSMDAWERMVRALTEEYNPIHNYDRLEDYTDHTNTQASGSSSNSATDETHSVQSERGINNSQGDLHSRSGSDVEGSGSNTGTSESTGTSETTHSAHLRGNIGVTQTQEMITNELKLRLSQQFADIILVDFKANFCVLVY